MLWSYPKFLPMVPSSFHLNQPIHLLSFSPKPHGSQHEATLHTSDIRQSLAFYLDRTKSFRQLPRFLLSIAERSKGSAISKQCVSKWILECIHLCYWQHKLRPPPGTWMHSTHLLSTSIAFLNNVLITGIARQPPGCPGHLQSTLHNHPQHGISKRHSEAPAFWRPSSTICPSPLCFRVQT